MGGQEHGKQTSLRMASFAIMYIVQVVTILVQGKTHSTARNLFKYANKMH